MTLWCAASAGQPPGQRRSIPSVMVDPAGEPNYLGLKDCFGRRSSTGRALPKIPVEQVCYDSCNYPVTLIPHSHMSSS